MSSQYRPLFSLPPIQPLSCMPRSWLVAGRGALAVVVASVAGRGDGHGVAHGAFVVGEPVAARHCF